MLLLALKSGGSITFDLIGACDLASHQEDRKKTCLSAFWGRSDWEPRIFLMLIRRPRLEMSSVEYILKFLKCQQGVEAGRKKNVTRTEGTEAEGGWARRMSRKAGKRDHLRPQIPSSTSERTFPPTHVLRRLRAYVQVWRQNPRSKSWKSLQNCRYSAWRLGKERARDPIQVSSLVMQSPEVLRGGLGLPWGRRLSSGHQPPQSHLPAQAFFTVNSVLVCV